MDRTAQKVHTRINLIVEILKHAQMSQNPHDSTNEPFFMNGPTKEFIQDFKNIPELPEGLNTNIRYLYQIIGNPSIEVIFKKGKYEQWTFMSLERALEIYQSYVTDGLTRVFDIAFKYMGMGHIEVLSCDLQTHNLFYHRSGGSNGWDRQHNHQKLLEFQGDPNEIYFLNWYCKFKKV